MTGDTKGEEQRIELEAPPVQPAPPPVVTAAPIDLATTDVLCKGCGFNLRGLTPDRNCPECGFSVWRTLQGEPLIYASTEYLRTLGLGVKWVLIGYLISLAVTAIGLVAAALTQLPSVAERVSTNEVESWFYLAEVPVNIVLLVGWWLFSAPDPGITAADKGDKPRVILRWTSVIALAAAILVGFIAMQGEVVLGVQIGYAAAAFISFAAGIAQFFASLLYVRWIARRMQDAKLVERASQYLWLLPLIYILGSCVLVGPIIATVMYLLLLNDVRKGVTVILERQAREMPAMEAAT